MKKFMMICAAMAALLSCSEGVDDQVVGGDDQAEGYEFSTTISLSGDDSQSRVATDYSPEGWEFNWAEGDKASIWYKYTDFDMIPAAQFYGYQSITMVEGTMSGDEASFSGTLYGRPSEYVLCHVANSFSLVGSERNPEFTTSRQTGNLKALAMIGEKLGNSDQDFTVESPALKHVNSFLELNINYSNIPEFWDDCAIPELKDITISGLNNKALYRFSDDDYAPEYTADDIIWTPSDDQKGIDKSMKCYICFMPTVVEAGETITLDIRFTNGAHYIYEKSFTGGAEFKRAKIYPLTIEADCADVDYYFYKDKYDNSVQKEYGIYSYMDLLTLSTLTNSGALMSESDNTFIIKQSIYMGNVTNWAPIGYDENRRFCGKFDGNVRSINALTFASTDIDAAGLFGYVDGAHTEVKNLKLYNFNITNSYDGRHTAVLAGTLSNGATILNCEIDASCSVEVSNRGAIGSLVGVGERGSKIYNSYNQGEVSCTWSGDADMVSIGGLCGSFSYSTIGNCYNSGTVKYAVSTNPGAVLGANSYVTYVENLYYKSGCAGSGVKAIGYTGSSKDELNNTFTASTTFSAGSLIEGYYALSEKGIYAANWKTDYSSGLPVLTYAD